MEWEGKLCFCGYFLGYKIAVIWLNTVRHALRWCNLRTLIKIYYIFFILNQSLYENNDKKLTHHFKYINKKVRGIYIYIYQIIYILKVLP